MTDTTEDLPKASTKPSKLSIVVLILLTLVGVGSGFSVIAFDLIPIEGLSAKPDAHEQDGHFQGLDDIAFVEIDPIMISLNSESESRQLRFRAQLEVDKGDKRAVEQIMPRIVDVLNGYLRALTLADLRDPLALMRLRAQMSRRISIVTGDVEVRDLLIMEFILN